MFQRVGVAVLGEYGHFDYSRFVLDDIDESKLNSTTGVSTTTNSTAAIYGTAHVCSDPPAPACGSNDYNIAAYNLVWRLNCRVDWRCSEQGNGTDSCDLSEPTVTGSFAQDVNGDGCIGILKGYDDWQNLTYFVPRQPGGGEAVRKEALPKNELDSKTPTLLTFLSVAKVNVTPTGEGNAVTWTRIPLQRVIGYELLRKGPSGVPSIVRRTKENQFVDKTALPGVSYAYSVRPIIVPSSESARQNLINKVENAVLNEPTMLEQRAKKLNLLPSGEKLLRGVISSEANIVTSTQEK